MKSEVDELEELKNEKEKFYGLKESQMKEFNTQVEKFVLECRNQVHELRKRLNEVTEISTLWIVWIRKPSKEIKRIFFSHMDVKNLYILKLFKIYKLKKKNK